MRTVRFGMFETNSSSTHSLTMCMKEDFDKWVNGDMYWNRWGERLATKEEVEKKYNDDRQNFINDHPEFNENDEEWQKKLKDYIDSDKTYYTYEEFNNYDYIEYETFEQNMTTKNGEEVVGFGYYGQDM